MYSHNTVGRLLTSIPSGLGKKVGIFMVQGYKSLSRQSALDVTVAGLTAVLYTFIIINSQVPYLPTYIYIHDRQCVSYPRNLGSAFV